MDDTTTTPSPAVHRVTWVGDRPTFHCEGDITSQCHLFPDCDCEVWSTEHQAAHPPVPHAEGCWVLPWLTNIDVECTWIGGEGMNPPPRHDGPITWEWDDGQVYWDYAVPELQASS